MDKERKGINLSDYAPPGTKQCQVECDREVVITGRGPAIICHYCMRIVRFTKK